ncbi:MAG: rRNA adenine N(6)-methyltransferase family protein [Candidatus Dojkabacteria bacterium]
MRNEIKYSQNFVKSADLIEEIVKTKTSLNSTDTVLEFGAGTGKITKVLAAKAGKVVTVEKDFDLYHELSEKYKEDKVVNVKVYNLDLLKFNLSTLEDYKVFSNIPFNLTSEIVRKLFLGRNPPKDTYLIMQKEAAWRLIGDYLDTSRFLGLLIKPFFRMEIVHDFDRDDFSPMPYVDIVLMRFEKKKYPEISKEERDSFYDFVTYAFANYRGHAKTSFTKLFTFEQFKRISTELKIKFDKSIADIRYAQWIEFYKVFKNLVSDDKKRYVNASYKKYLMQKGSEPKVERRSRVGRGNQ